jgi:hypothetical protein
MPGFSSLDDFISKTTVSGKFWRQDWNKNFNPTTAAVAGEWHSLFRGGGNPAADALLNTGTNLAFNEINFTTTNATGIPHGGDVGSADTSQSWARSGTTVTVTTASHNLAVNDGVLIASSSDTGALPNGRYLVATVPTSGTYTITGVNTGATSGTATTTRPHYKTILNASAFSAAATTMPAVAMLVDLLAYYRLTSVTTTSAQNTTGSATSSVVLPRYSSGAGVQAFFVNSNATPLGAATPNLSIGYTNAAGTASRATPTVLPVGKTAASNSLILYSGTAAGKYGPFVPLQAGDTGIRSIQTIQNSTSYVSGEYSVVMCKPLLTLPMTTIGVAAERDLMNQVPSLPKVYDGACLTWLIYSGANTPTNSAFYGHLDFGWG